MSVVNLVFIVYKSKPADLEIKTMADIMDYFGIQICNVDNYSGNLREYARKCSKRLEEKGDEVNAFKWYKKAAEQGHEEAWEEACWHARFIESNSEESAAEAFEWFKRAAQEDDDFALYELGCCYSNGIGTEVDYEKAFECFIKSAEQDNDEAQYELGLCYEYGDGTE